MFKDSLCTFVVFCLCKLFCTTYGKFLEIPELPQIACPNYFQYIENGNTYFGKLTLPNIQEGAQVNVEFSLRKELNNVSSLSLDQDEEATSKKIQSGEPISYRVDFPLANVVPKLTQIAINGMVICSAIEYPSPSILIKLQHTLRTNLASSRGERTKRDTDFDDVIEEAKRQFSSNIDTKFGDLFDIAQNHFSSNPTNANDLLQEARKQFSSSSTDTGTNADDFFKTHFSSDPFFSTALNIPEVQQSTVSNGPNNSSSVYTVTKKIYRTQSSAPQRPQQQKPQSTQPQVEQRVTESVCGQEGTASNKFSPYIYGGSPLRRGEYPWLTAIYRKHALGSNFICGGSLISVSFVLTAAHCFDSLTADKIAVSLGRYNLTNSMEDVVSRDIRSIILNPEYKRGDNRFPDADLALLRMYADVRFTNLIKPICLWLESDDESLIVGKSAMVAGWGTDENNSPSQVPKKVASKIVSDRECLSSPHGFGNIKTERTLCAGNLDGTGPCHGDSGGGLMVLRNNRWVLRGIVSAGQYEQSRCNLLQYVIFCDVAKHLKWVQGYL